MYKKAICIIAIIVVMMEFLIFGFAIGVNMDQTDKENQDYVLYPKSDMKVNEVSKNTVVITTLDFEDAFKEIKKTAKNIEKAEK